MLQPAYGQAVDSVANPTAPLERRFSPVDPSLDQLKGFAAEAASKLEALEGYLLLIGNPDNEEAVRAEAEDLVRSSFHEEDLTLEHPFSLSGISLGAFVNFFSSADEDLFFVASFSEIDKGEIPYWHEDGYYAGTMVFHFNLKRVNRDFFSSEEKALWYKINYRIERQLELIEDHEKAVWEVRLGCITKN